MLSLKGKPGVVLVDARPTNESLGDDEIWLRKGHIPGAVSFHRARLMTADKEVLVYCGTSREGSLLRFYLKHVMKYPNVRLYEGSWKEYAHLKQHPVETRPPALAAASAASQR